MVLNHFFSPGSQLTITFNTGEGPDAPAFVTTRNRLPSAITSYPNAKKSGGWAACASNNGWGFEGSKEGLAPSTALTATAIIFPSGLMKNSSFPSPLHRGCTPPAIEILH